MIRCEAIGVLGRDSELRSTSGGTQVLGFSVAAKGARRDADTVWLSCSLFGARAEKLQGYLVKGKRVFVRGEMRIRQWSKGEKSGVDVDVTVDEVELLGGAEEQRHEGDRSSSPRRPTRAAPPPSDNPYAEAFDAADEIPF